MGAIVSEAPRSAARLAGLLYLATIVCGIFAEAYVRGSLIVRGDAAATSANILARESLYRLGIAADLMMLLAYIGVTGLFYVIFRPAGRSLSIIAAMASLTGIAVAAANCVMLFVPLLLRAAPDFAAAAPAQATLAYLAIRLHGQGYALSILFFGAYCVLIGWLIFRARFLPGFLGILLAFAGGCYLIDSITGVLGYSLPAWIDARLLLPGLIGEGALGLWLVLAGIDPVKWKAQAGTPGT